MKPGWKVEIDDPVTYRLFGVIGRGFVDEISNELDETYFHIKDVTGVWRASSGGHFWLPGHGDEIDKALDSAQRLIG